MKGLKSLLHQLAGVKALRSFRTTFLTIEGIVFGTPETTSEAPHFVDHIDIKRYMSIVILALLPAAAASIYFYGWQAVKIILVSYIAGGVVEVIFAVIRKKEIEEGFLVTGLIFPLILPPTVPMWWLWSALRSGYFSAKRCSEGPAGIFSIPPWLAGSSSPSLFPR